MKALMMCLAATIALGNLGLRTYAEDLVIPNGETKNVTPGDHRYQRLEIGENSTLGISGTTTILADQLISAKGATIQYAAGSQAANPAKILTIHAVDASAVRFLKVIGNGAPGEGHAAGDHAKDGGKGEDAGGIKPFKRPKGHGSSPGGAGAAGVKGKKGEDALNVTLYLPRLKPGAEISTELIGGNGGRGQDGGNGGKGGNKNVFFGASDGGHGGAAGEGGDSGDSGKLKVFLVVASDESGNSDQLLKTISIRPIYGHGEVGAPGEPGHGGNHGEGHALIKVGEASGQHGGDGAAAGAGKPGNGPKQGEVNRDWASIEVMDTATYAKYLADIITLLEKSKPMP